jgi:uncharacterized membrane protein
VEGLQTTANEFQAELRTLQAAFEDLVAADDEPGDSADKDALAQALAHAVRARLRPVLDEYRPRTVEMAAAAQAERRQALTLIRRVEEVTRQLDKLGVAAN